MAIIKCKMCGGDLNIVEDASTAECEFCGSVQTVPKVDDEKKLTLFARANRLRAACEFDKAAGIYEAIVADFQEEAEAYWGLVLCKYGIEYVDDPATGKKIPTCHRSSFDSIMEDSDFEQVLENADPVARKVYREESKTIEEIRKGIIAVSANERPYDIFICYKETAENGERTLDSVLAQDVYDALTDKGYRTFFARITLEDKLGMEYEPYIFAALNSAKIMLVFGTDYEYFNAVWVKNEWSRFLKLMSKDKEKHLIPCFKGIDAYDMPKEFARLQAQDMGKVGAIQDLLRGIEKLLPRQAETTTVIQERVVVGGSGNNKIASLLDRGNMALEDGDWAKADSFFEDVLNNDAKNAQAYLGKTLAMEKCRTIDAFVRKRKEISQTGQFERRSIQPHTEHIAQMVQQYAIPGYVTEKSIEELYVYDLGYPSEVESRRRQYAAEQKFWQDHKQLSRAEKFAVGAVAENLQREKKALFAVMTQRLKLAEEREAEEQKKLQAAYTAHITKADQQAEQLFKNGQQRRETLYLALLQMAKNESDMRKLGDAAKALDALGDYRDSKKLASHCRNRIAEIRAEQEAAARQARILREKAHRAKIERAKRIAISVAVCIVLLIAATLVTTKVLIPAVKFSQAEALLADKQCVQARDAFFSIADYGNSRGMMRAIQELETLEAGKYDEAIRAILGADVQITIQYETGGGSELQSGIYQTEEQYTGLANAGREGYRFVSWRLAQWQYVKKEGFILTFEAVWSDGYLITYELNGGSALLPSEYHKEGNAVSLKNPARKGYTFTGWTGTDLSKPTVDVTIPAGSYGDRHYIAHWELNTYTVNLDAAGGRLSQDSLQVRFGEAYTLPKPTKTHYTFAGWYYGNTKYENGKWEQDSDVTLVARWQLKKYDIQYHLDGGTNAPENPEQYTVQSATIQLCQPSRNGCKFLGWYADSDYTQEISDIPTGSSGKIDVYAKWEILTYGITYYLDGGSISSVNPDNYTVISEDIVLSEPTRIGYTFAGWYTSKDFKTKLTKISKGSYGELSLYAKWEPIHYSVTYHLSGGNNMPGNPGSYTIETNTIKLLDPARMGYEFKGWYRDSDFTTKVTEIPLGSTGAITLYAKWEIIHYTINYVRNGGQIDGVYKTSFTIEDLPVTLPEIIHSDMLFLNWAVDTFQGEPIEQITQGGNVTVAACFMDPNLSMKLSTNGKYYIVDNYNESSGTATNLVIPAYYKGLPVKEIASYAFACSIGGSDSKLVSITMPDSITKIGDEAFKYCKALKTIHLSNSLASIGEWAFYSCESLASVVFPSSLKSIGDIAFAHCVSLTSVTIPDSVTYVGGQCFSDCTKLKTVKLGSGITTIEYNTFDGCSSLTSINIPDSVTTIDSSAFRGCKALTKIIIPQSVSQMDTAFSGCTNLTIYCRAKSIQEGWAGGWNGNCKVVWGYTGD